MNIITKELIEILKVNSKSSNLDGVNKVGNMIKNYLLNVPLSWEKCSKKGKADFLIAKSLVMDLTKPIIILSAHLDVVFNADEVNIDHTSDKIYGSGVCDMKSSLIVIIEILRRLNKDNQLKNIIITFSPQEELATPDYRNIIESVAKQGDYILVFESTKTLLDDPLNTRSVVVSRRGFQGLELKISGPGGHSGVLFKKEERKSCILKMAEFILEAEKLSDYKKVTTLNSGIVNAGKGYNILAPNAQVIFETRFKVEKERIRVLKGLNKIIDKLNTDKAFTFNLTQDIFFPAMFKSINNELLLKICRKVANIQNINLIEEERGGGGESSLFQHFNPKACILDGFGVHGGGEHTTNEFIFTESLFSTIEFDFQVIKSILYTNK